jgi:hypothetical protein
MFGCTHSFHGLRIEGSKKRIGVLRGEKGVRNLFPRLANLEKGS